MAVDRKPFKVVILGAEKTGKSALVKKYVHSVFTEEYNPSFEGTDHKQLSLDRTLYAIDIIAAEPAAENVLTQTGEAFILLYAINNRKTFQHLRQLHNQVKTAKGSLVKTPIFLVGSKVDLEADRQVSVEEGRQLATELKCQKLFEISAKSHSAEINDMFEKLVRELLRAEGDATSIPAAMAPVPATPSHQSTHNPTSPVSDTTSPRRSSNVFDRLKLGSIKRKASWHSLTRKKSGSFSESILSFGSKNQSRDNVRSTSHGNALGAAIKEPRQRSPFRLDVDTSSWRETIKWPTEIIPEEDQAKK